MEIEWTCDITRVRSIGRRAPVYKGLGGETNLIHACRVYVDKWLHWSFGGILVGGRRGLWEGEEQWGTTKGAEEDYSAREGQVKEQKRNTSARALCQQRRNGGGQVKERRRNTSARAPCQQAFTVCLSTTPTRLNFEKKNCKTLLQSGLFLLRSVIGHCWRLPQRV